MSAKKNFVVRRFANAIWNSDSIRDKKNKFRVLLNKTRDEYRGENG